MKKHILNRMFKNTLMALGVVTIGLSLASCNFGTNQSTIPKSEKTTIPSYTISKETTVPSSQSQSGIKSSESKSETSSSYSKSEIEDIFDKDIHITFMNEGEVFFVETGKYLDKLNREDIPVPKKADIEKVSYFLFIGWDFDGDGVYDDGNIIQKFGNKDSIATACYRTVPFYKVTFYLYSFGSIDKVLEVDYVKEGAIIKDIYHGETPIIYYEGDITESVFQTWGDKNFDENQISLDNTMVLGDTNVYTSLITQKHYFTPVVNLDFSKYNKDTWDHSWTKASVAGTEKTDGNLESSYVAIVETYNNTLKEYHKSVYTDITYDWKDSMAMFTGGKLYSEIVANEKAEVIGTDNFNSINPVINYFTGSFTFQDYLDQYVGEKDRGIYDPYVKVFSENRKGYEKYGEMANQLGLVYAVNKDNYSEVHSVIDTSEDGIVVTDGLYEYVVELMNNLLDHDGKSWNSYYCKYQLNTTRYSYVGITQNEAPETPAIFDEYTHSFGIHI